MSHIVIPLFLIARKWTKSRKLMWIEVVDVLLMPPMFPLFFLRFLQILGRNLTNFWFASRTPYQFPLLSVGVCNRGEIDWQAEGLVLLSFSF